MSRLGVVLTLSACGRIHFDAPIDAVEVDVPITGCTTGALLSPVAVLNASLSTAADACNIDNALALDGAVAGLDRSGTPVQCKADWDLSGTCGCLALDLGAAYPIAQVQLHARAVAKACTYACIPGNGCGTGNYVAVLSGVALNNYRNHKHVMLTPVLAPYDVTIDDDARYVVLCRNAWGEQRDDIEVDFVSIACR